LYDVTAPFRRHSEPFYENKTYVEDFPFPYDKRRHRHLGRGPSKSQIDPSAVGPAPGKGSLVWRNERPFLFWPTVSFWYPCIVLLSVFAHALFPSFLLFPGFSSLFKRLPRVQEVLSATPAGPFAEHSRFSFLTDITLPCSYPLPFSVVPLPPLRRGSLLNDQGFFFPLLRAPV